MYPLQCRYYIAAGLYRLTELRILPPTEYLKFGVRESGVVDQSRQLMFYRGKQGVQRRGEIMSARRSQQLDTRRRKLQIFQSQQESLGVAGGLTDAAFVLADRFLNITAPEGQNIQCVEICRGYIQPQFAGLGYFGKIGVGQSLPIKLRDAGNPCQKAFKRVCRLPLAATAQ